jgi:hypothetical protein
MPEKTICYNGEGAMTKNGNHTEKQFREVMKRNKTKVGVSHKGCAKSRKKRKCRSCKAHKIILNNRLLKQLDTKKEEDITKEEERLYEKCVKCGNRNLKPCTLEQYMEFVGADPIACPEPTTL